MKIVTLEQLSLILEALPPNPRVVASGNFATPATLLNAVDGVVPEYRLHMLNAQRGIPTRPGVRHETAFVGPGMRKSATLDYLPSRLSLVPVLFRDHCRPDAVLLHTSAVRHDTVSLGTEVNILPGAIESAHEHGGIVIAQANPQMPYTYGDAQIYEHEIDFLVEVDEPLPSHEPGAVGLVAAQIGDLIANRISDHSTLQLGIGAVPDAVLHSLKDRRGLRIWSEMFSDGVLDLFESGVLDSEVPITSSFVFGSHKLYEWMHLNHSVRMLRTEKTNDPGLIARQARMTSVNAALQVDLFDQVNASHVNGHIYSGFGGSTDFIVGALHSRGGQSFVALPSWHAKADVSGIVPMIQEPVTHFQHSSVVTEHGVADVFGRTQKQQARAIIDIADERIRPELEEAAMQFNLM